MNTLYLDMRDLVALGRAQKGRPDAIHLQPALERLRQLAIRSKIVAPLSESHCYEIWNIGTLGQRHVLAELAILLSRRVALAPLRTIWKQEFAHVLVQFGAQPAGSVTPFGVGVSFAFGFDEYRFPPEATETQRFLTETYLLVEPNRSRLTRVEVERRRDWDAWAAYQSELARQLSIDRHKHNDYDRAAMGTLSLFGQDVLTQVIGSVPDPNAYLDELRDHGPWALVKRMPAVAVLSELFRVRWADAEAKWSRSDFHDLRYLSVALAYCDFVSVDKNWAALATRSDYIQNLRSKIFSGSNTVEQMLDSVELDKFGSDS